LPSAAGWMCLRALVALPYLWTCSARAPMLGGGGKANGRFYDLQRPLPHTLIVNLGSAPPVPWIGKQSSAWRRRPQLRRRSAVPSTPVFRTSALPPRRTTARWAGPCTRPSEAPGSNRPHCCRCRRCAQGRQGVVLARWRRDVEIGYLANCDRHARDAGILTQARTCSSCRRFSGRD